ncbi:MAG: hypothetical protein LBM96_11755 [Methanobrevibacter sp.]|nr:hypothetical protein [Candidatus Methanoflexus mossambicus]
MVKEYNPNFVINDFLLDINSFKSIEANIPIDMIINRIIMHSILER